MLYGTLWKNWRTTEWNAIPRADSNAGWSSFRISLQLSFINVFILFPKRNNCDWYWTNTKFDTTLYKIIYYNWPNALSPLKRLSNWMYSLEVLNFKSKCSSSIYSSPFRVTGLPFMSIDTFKSATNSKL